MGNVIILEPKMFAIYAVGVCRHCGKDIERRRLIGWLHVDAFFMCLGQKDGPFTDAEPA